MRSGPPAPYAETMPKLLDKIYRMQAELTDLDPDEQRLLKMFGNLLESHYEVKEPRNRLTVDNTGKCRAAGNSSTACWDTTDHRASLPSARPVRIRRAQSALPFRRAVSAADSVSYPI